MQPLESLFAQQREARQQLPTLLRAALGAVWCFFSRIFSGLLLPLEEMPAELRGPGVTDGLAQRANEAFASYLRLLGERRFHEAAAELEALSRTLEELQGPFACLARRAVAGCRA